MRAFWLRKRMVKVNAHKESKSRTYSGSKATLTFRGQKIEFFTDEAIRMDQIEMRRIADMEPPKSGTTKTYSFTTFKKIKP